MTTRKPSGAKTSAYRPFTPTRRPGGKPAGKPLYRVLVHRRHERAWHQLADRIGLDQAQRFYDHVSASPATVPAGVRVTKLKGSAGRAKESGFSSRLHWRVPGSPARIDYEYCDEYRGGRQGDPHRVVRVVAINYSSH